MGGLNESIYIGDPTNVGSPILNVLPRENRWDEFKKDYKNYSFKLAFAGKFYSKRIDDELYLMINNKTKELQLITPLGCSPFMEAQTQYYQDLIDDSFIEYKQGKFD